MIYNTKLISGTIPRIKRIGFDFDGTVINLESQNVYDKHGLRAFHQYEKYMQHIPHGIGSVFSFFRQCLKDRSIQVHIITARSIITQKRVNNTLKQHNIKPFLTDIHYQDGKPKQELIKHLSLDVYIDDQLAHLKPVNNCCMLQVINL